MNKFQIFVIRAILGAVLAVLLMRMFHPEMPAVYVAGLGILMVGLAYVFEYLRNRKTDKS